MRLSRWRPVCPECGYSLRALPSMRCPECGHDLPTANRSFRRWAKLRLPWDRATRASLIGAYLATVALIILNPRAAARGTCVPDRWQRAGRWAAIHLLAAAFVAMLTSQVTTIWWCGTYWFGGNPFHHPAAPFEFNRALHVILIAVSIVAASWLVALSMVLVPAALLSLFLPSRHRVARLAGVKLLLYGSSVLLMATLAWFLACCVSCIGAKQWIDAAIRFDECEPLYPTYLALAFGFWWSIGMSGNPYGRTREFWVVALWLPAYAGVWALLAYGLFPAGVLETLL